jgi:hypothetical protein
LTFGGLGVAISLLALVIPMRAEASGPNQTSFPLFVNPAVKNCVSNPAGDKLPEVTATVTGHNLNDTMTLTLKHFRPNLAFDLFTIQNSNQQANGDPVSGFTNFGLAWYQSDIETNKAGSGHVTIKTILLNQIFGFDPAVGLAPTNTFHVGFWFNNPMDASTCVNVTTPFNGEHNAGPLAFISRPDPNTNLGPLCINPDTSHTPATCNP